jgi:hypothetical protein
MKYLLSLTVILSLNVHSQEIANVSDDTLVCQKIITGEQAVYERLITKFGGKKVASSQFTRDEQGLQNYIDKSGIRYFSATEIMTPHNEKGAIKCGVENLIPPQCIWSNGIALMSIFERIREIISGPIMFRNWWRPNCYNTLVDGAKASDHLLAKSIDIDFRNPQDRAVAQNYICNELWKKGENIQVGIGCNSLHIGLASPKGKRFWIYPSMTNCPVKMIDKCWAK